MSRESRIFKATIYNTQKTIEHYESFGWELLSINNDQIVMSRETQNPIYSDLVKAQAEYEETLKEYQSIVNPTKPTEPAPFDFFWCLIGFVALIIPGVIYTVYKNKQKEAYELEYYVYSNKLNVCEQKRKTLKDKMKQIAQDSRANFFARQQQA